MQSYDSNLEVVDESCIDRGVIYSQSQPAAQPCTFPCPLKQKIRYTYMTSNGPRPIIFSLALARGPLSRFFYYFPVPFFDSLDTFGIPADAVFRSLSCNWRDVLNKSHKRNRFRPCHALCVLDVRLDGPIDQ